MSEVTRLLSDIECGDPTAADRLLPLVYDELRRLARARLVHEQPGQTLQATALVHEAYLRLVDVDNEQAWNSRGHFFAAAAEAMRRILVERARTKKRAARAGVSRRMPFNESELPDVIPDEELLALDEALVRLKSSDPVAANLVELRYFAGLTMRQAADAMGLALRTAERNWTYARTWLHRELHRQ